MKNDIRKNIETKISQKLTDEEFEKLSEWFFPIQLENKVQFVNEDQVSLISVKFQPIYKCKVNLLATKFSR